MQPAISENLTLKYPALEKPHFSAISETLRLLCSKSSIAREIKSRVDSWRGKIIAGFDMNSGENTAAITSGIFGKRAVYFDDGEAAFDRCTFDR